MPHCPSCQNSVDPKINAKCPACGLSLKPVSVGSAVKPAARPKLPVDLTVAVDIDITGSSNNWTSGIADFTKTVLKGVEAKAASVTCFLVSHGDIDCGQDPTIVSSGVPADDAIADVQSLAFDQGGDPEEHHLDGLEFALNAIPWPTDPSSRGCIIGIMNANTKPATSGVSPTELGRQVKAKGLMLFLCCEPYPALEDFRAAADGTLISISNNPDPAEMQRVAAELAKSITQSASHPGKSTKPI